MPAPPKASHPSEAHAISRVLASDPDARLRHWWGSRVRDGWFVTYAPGTFAPQGGGSWLVMDSGRVEPVSTGDTFDEAWERATT